MVAGPASIHINCSSLLAQGFFAVSRFVWRPIMMGFWLHRLCTVFQSYRPQTFKKMLGSLICMISLSSPWPLL